MERTITIKMTEEQYRAYKEGMEFYSRFISGQWTSLPPVLQNFMQKVGIDHYGTENIYEYLNQAKTILYPELEDAQYIGVGQRKKTPLGKEVALSYAMYREALRIDNEEKGKKNTLTSPTLNYTKHPLIEVTKLQDETA